MIIENSFILKKGYVFIDGGQAIDKESKSVFNYHVHFADRGNRLIAEHMFNIIDSHLISQIFQITQR